MPREDQATRLDHPDPHAPTPEARPPVTDTLPFPMAEYAAKRIRIQAELHRRGLAGALIFDPENIFWLTGYRSIGYFTFQALYIPVAGELVLISRIVNRALGRATPTIGAVVAI